MPEETEKDEILKEIAERLKEIKNEELSEEEPEKSGLEEEVDLNALDFNQFISPMHEEDVGAPVLERIAGFQPRPIFVGGISRGPAITEEEKKSDEIKYVPSQEENNEPKYIEADTRISREPERIDFSRVGREPTEIPQINQERFSISSQSESPERQWRAEQIDIERAGREDPFKREEIQKYKPKTPKSY